MRRIDVSVSDRSWPRMNEDKFLKCETRKKQFLKPPGGVPWMELTMITIIMKTITGRKP